MHDPPYHPLEENNTVVSGTDSVKDAVSVPPMQLATPRPLIAACSMVSRQPRSGPVNKRKRTEL